MVLKNLVFFRTSRVIYIGIAISLLCGCYESSIYGKDGATLSSSQLRSIQYLSSIKNFSGGYIEMEVSGGGFGSERESMVAILVNSQGGEHVYGCAFGCMIKLTEDEKNCGGSVTFGYKEDNNLFVSPNHLEFLNHFSSKASHVLGCELVQERGKWIVNSYYDRMLKSSYIVGSGYHKIADPGVTQGGRVGFLMLKPTSHVGKETVSVRSFVVFDRRPF